MQSLVSTQWLERHLDDPDLVVLDCTNFAELGADGCDYRTVSGRGHWNRGHIDRAGHVDFTQGSSGDDTCFRNTLPDPEEFVSVMAGLGVGDDRRVVLYDSAMSMWAARVWWMLRWVGFDSAAILDGGWQSWEEEGRRTSTQSYSHPDASLTLCLRPELFVTRETVAASLDDEFTCIIDALSEAQFRGESSDLGLCGHIPGALNIPARRLVYADGGCYLPEPKLAGWFPENRSRRTIIYCGSGIAAASNAFVMTRLGFTDLTIYMPGLQEWVQHADAPLVKGAE